MKRWYKIHDILLVFTYLIAAVGYMSTVGLVAMPFVFAFLALAALALAGDMIPRLSMPKYTVEILSVITVLFGLSRLSAQEIVLPGLETLLLMLGLKCLDKKGARDYLQIYALSVLLVAGSSLLSLDLMFFFYLTALVVLLAPAIVLLNFERGRADLSLSGKELFAIVAHSLLMPMLVIPLTLALFVILPRTSYPLLSFLNRPSKAGSGFSDAVRLGNVSQIQLDDTLVFRAAMERQPERSLYWRGIVFDEFDGRTWRDSGAAAETKPSPGLKGPVVGYTVYLEPSEHQTLFTLDRPVHISYRQLLRYEDRTYRAQDHLNRKISYQGVSVLTDRESAPAVDMDRYLELPSRLEELHEFSAQLTAGMKTSEVPTAILSYLRDPKFRYSLKQLPRSESPILDFLFRFHTGNCEYFASAMAAMLRSRGIPSRLIGGYRGGYFHEVGGYYVIQQRDAHVWVEAYLPEEGWRRFDPTPAQPVESHRTPLKQFLFRLRMTMDILDYYWNRHVISYDLQRQYSLLAAATKGFSLPQGGMVAWGKLGHHLLPLTFGAVLLTALIIIRHLRKKRLSPEQRLLRKFLGEMARRGWRRREYTGLEEFVSGINDKALRELGEMFVKVFQDSYYRDRKPQRADLHMLAEILQQLKRQPIKGR